MLTDCSSIQGSTASSSSDAMTLATTSSWCAISIPSSASAAAAAASTRLRILRLIRPHARRILVTPDTSPSFGFAVRGGKEFGTGFFISSVERSSEAELKGMRIGDQILRINGFRVDDAIHRELIQFITNQDRITMKVRSVGMLPIKEKGSDKLSWHAVKTYTNGSSASSESSYKTLPERDTRSKDVNITLNVAPRTKLGLGICKGPEWKPGIFVQFTKEKSVAREAGLRQGDQILSVNSIDFSDVLFSEAVAVMKSANKLEMIVRTAAGCDLFPGESSGYNSSASSVTGDQSPCWADAKSKRLTSVREEPTPAPSWNEAGYVEQHRRGEQPGGSSKQRKDAQEKKSVGSQQQVNKTIIKLSDQGTSINNTFVSNTQSMALGRNINEYGTPKVRTTVGGSHEAQPHTAMSSTNSTNANSASYVTREERETKMVTVEVHRQEADEARRLQQLQLQQKQTQQLQQQRAELNSHHRHSALQHSLPNHTTPAKQAEFQKCLRATATNCNQQLQLQQQQQQTGHLQKLQQQQGAAYGRNTCQVDSSSLSSAITEELKKRKEKQRINAATTSNNNNNNTNSQMGSSNTNSHSNYANINGKQNNYGQSRQQQQQQHHHHHTAHQPLTSKTQQQQQQQQSHCYPTPLSPSSSSLSLSATPTTKPNASLTAASTAAATATAIATLSARTTSDTVNGSERNNHCHSNSNNTNSKNSASAGIGVGIGVGVGVGVGVSAGDQHSALMDEFKRAHQRMFKNGFQETERKERQEALRNTTMMEDDVNHRASRVFRNDNGPTTNITQFQIPPPPPQFASSPPRTQPQYTNNSASNKFSPQPQPQSQLQQKPINNYNHSSAALKPPTEQPPKPPATPVPDYDNVEIRTKPTTISSSARPSYGYASTNIVTNGRDAINDNINNNNNNINNNCSHRRTQRAGTITIGEYEQPQPRREPAKFDFVGAPKRCNNVATDVCVENLQAELQSTLTRSKLKKSAEPLEHQSHCPLRNSYEDYENVARKLHGVSINEVATTAPAMRMSNGMTNGGTNGILKNGSRHSGGVNGSKNSDKTITFGN